MREAGVYTARGIHELSMMVHGLSQQGFRIVTVVDTQNGDYHVVAQQEIDIQICGPEVEVIGPRSSG